MGGELPVDNLEPNIDADEQRQMSTTWMAMATRSPERVAERPTATVRL